MLLIPEHAEPNTENNQVKDLFYTMEHSNL